MVKVSGVPYEVEFQNEDKTKADLLDSLAAAGNAFNEAMDNIEKESEAYWNTLTDQQRLDVFCAVCRRIYEGEIKLRGSYRYVLYDVFGFGPEAYAQAQMSGYLTIHNAIMDENYDERLVTKFAEFAGVDKEKVSEFLKGNI